ncbi:hypothetical protein R69619_03334 [Paraburkholderia nemoris]|uniref:hypothetical protein n=1 Tax=Paraburkholderia nemoris TaxID=2793076 RepID=UPI00190B8FC5|nr:hypothetical protein [Paraburkholderia nemoris]MBK3743352.1 hypothetical protein [Paraburkholderia aspalathi]CAE6760110.1 hypothetical protein R69619_03334 [Paraburkholderia nemoris]
MTIACYEIENDERQAVDRAAMRGQYLSSLRRIAEGDAPSLELRTMALRALHGINVTGVPLRDFAPTAFELATLNRMNAAAVARLRLH